MTESRDAFESLLRQRNEHPERLEEIDRTITARFSARRAVLVLDMSGFSRLTHRYGVIHFLAMIQRMRDLVLPLLVTERFGGRVVKCEADNVFAVFSEVDPAVDAAFAIQDVLAGVNAVLPADWDVHVAIGIGYGDLLLVGDDDLYGHQMNLASKLGEDLGEPGEILLTPEAAERLTRDRLRREARARMLGPLELRYVSLTRA
jgi:adenylate cyclase